jgi:hypothetical protein
MGSDRKSTDSSSLAAAASEQIRAIIEAAEQTAAQIRATAEDEAAGIRREAEEEATGIRSQARGDIQALLNSIRTAVNSASADLERLEERLAPQPAPPEPAPPPPEPVEKPVATAPHVGADVDIESARLVALNMALDGTSREQVDRYLRENFALSDREALLDDVYASIGG